MSPRKPAVLRGAGDGDLRAHLIATAAALIADRGTASLSVRDIARAARVADGVLYNYFADKDDLLAHGLLAHVADVTHNSPALLPAPGTGTVAVNLRGFVEGGVEILARIVPAFAGLISQPKVLLRFHEMVGGGAAFGAPEEGAPAAAINTDATENGLPAQLDSYLRGEQRLGRIGAGVDVGAVVALVTGAIHGQVLPRLLFAPPGQVAALPPGLAERLVGVLLHGIAPAPAG